jgi:broad specificity phosphatase PhoE
VNLSGSVKPPFSRDGSLSSGDALKETDLPGRITFISHAPTAALRRAAFSFDESIESRELEKLVSIGWIPPRVHQVFAGPELRTRQTASALGLDPILSAELKDLDYSSWRGKSLDEVQSTDPQGVELWLTNVDAAPHGGESLASLLARIEHWLGGQNGSGHTLALTHPAVIRAAILLALQAPAQSFWRIDIPPVSITDLRWSGRFWTLRSSGCTLSRREK